MNDTQRAAVGLISIVFAAGVFAQTVKTIRPQQISAPVAVVSPANVTWVHIESQYEGPNNSVYTRHYYLRVDRIDGIGGPFPWWSRGQETKRMSLYIDGDKYPTVTLDDLGSMEENLKWILALDAVSREKPGGIVDLAAYLPTE